MYLSDLTIGFSQHIVASAISIHPLQGRLSCLLGRNGCGKSTLLKTIAGFLKPLSGEMTFQGQNLQDMSRKRLSRTIGIVMTGRVESQNLTVRELAGLGRAPYTGFFGSLSPEDREAVDHAMEMAGIQQLADRTISTLSDGEYQKAIIAKTLAQETPVILLDEPTAFLDYASKVELMETASRLAHESGKLILMSTHDVSLALHLSDDIFLMSGGEIRKAQAEDDVKKFVGPKAARFL